MRWSRYGALLATQVRVNLATATRYRLDFFGAGVMAMFWVAWNIVPLLVLFDERDTVAGWDKPSALLLVAVFIVLRGFLNAIVEPSLTDTIEKIRSGSFDYVLLKPLDSQALASTSKFDVWRFFDMASGLVVGGYAFAMRGTPPAIADILVGALLLAAGAAAMYAIWLTATAFAFFVVKIDNLMYLLESIFDVARWPIDVFRGLWRLVFTFVLPVAVMTSFPALALFGKLQAGYAVVALVVAAVLLVVARVTWRLALRNYTSASS